VNNISAKNQDARTIQKIIFEKANFGALPLYFKIVGDPRLHPVQWIKHPHLSEIHFSDGTTSHVTAQQPTQELEAKVGPIPDGKTDRTIYEGEVVTDLYALQPELESSLDELSILAEDAVMDQTPAADDEDGKENSDKTLEQRMLDAIHTQ
jgi:hypothetical protein